MDQGGFEPATSRSALDRSAKLIDDELGLNLL